MKYKDRAVLAQTQESQPVSAPQGRKKVKVTAVRTSAGEKVP